MKDFLEGGLLCARHGSLQTTTELDADWGAPERMMENQQQQQQQQHDDKHTNNNNNNINTTTTTNTTPPSHQIISVLGCP